MLQLAWFPDVENLCFKCAFLTTNEIYKNEPAHSPVMKIHQTVQKYEKSDQNHKSEQSLLSEEDGQDRVKL